MAQLVLARHPQTTFHIVGGAMGRGGSYTESLKALAVELGIAARVRFWGYLADDAARDILASSDLFVLPSSEEGFGLVLAESQACGVPVLATAMRPLDEVIDDGQTGFLLPQDDHVAFADKATELLADASLRHSLAIAGRRWVESRFSCRAHVSRMSALYEEVLSAGPSRRAVPVSHAT
jgi:glycosyltransferase involved in cell wall biosynthesis